MKVIDDHEVLQRIPFAIGHVGEVGDALERESQPRVRAERVERGNAR